jgi:phosphoenolpyruvate-protein kinase (PTS system EI component)
MTDQELEALRVKVRQARSDQDRLSGSLEASKKELEKYTTEAQARGFSDIKSIDARQAEILQKEKELEAQILEILGPVRLVGM